MIRTNPFDDEQAQGRVRHFSGIIGTKGMQRRTQLLGLHALQHRGQEAAGIVSFDGQRFHPIAHMGHVGDTFGGTERDRAASRAIPPSATSATQPPAAPFLRIVQPLFADMAAGGFALAHNGNLTNSRPARPSWSSAGAFSSRPR